MAMRIIEELVLRQEKENGEINEIFFDIYTKEKPGKRQILLEISQGCIVSEDDPDDVLNYKSDAMIDLSIEEAKQVIAMLQAQINKVKNEFGDV